MKKIKKKQFIVNIETPYLHLDVKDFIKRGEEEFLEKQINNKKRNEEFIKNQVEEFAYDNNNLNNVDLLKTKKFNIEFKISETRTKEDFFNYFKKNKSNLIIIGCTKSVENSLIEFKNSGFLIGRYSTFYGNESEYSGLRPEQSGYSFDIPKDVDTVKKLLTHDETLEAILSKSEKKIRKGIFNLNKDLKKPIIITSFLQVALEYTRHIEKIEELE